MLEFGKIVLFGVGLIGGSFALALKKANAVEEIVGFSRSPNSLKIAQEIGIIDRAGINPAHEIADADVIMFATPVQQIPMILEKIFPYLKNPNTILTDVGSSKSEIVQQARKIMKGKIGQFVPAHPIAGTEFSGPKAAFPELFQNKKLVLTPLKENKDEFLDRIKLAWRICGAEIFELDPESHDTIFAGVSHLPHMLSFALVADLANRENSNLFFEFAASGFRDFTRIAASDAEMWRDICLSNRYTLIAEISHFQAVLNNMTAALATNDKKMLEQIFSQASQARNEWAKNKQK